MAARARPRRLAEHRVAAAEPGRTSRVSRCPSSRNSAAMTMAKARLLPTLMRMPTTARRMPARTSGGMQLAQRGRGRAVGAVARLELVAVRGERARQRRGAGECEEHDRGAAQRDDADRDREGDRRGGAAAPDPGEQRRGDRRQEQPQAERRQHRREPGDEEQRGAHEHRRDEHRGQVRRAAQPGRDVARAGRPAVPAPPVPAGTPLSSGRGAVARSVTPRRPRPA